MNDKSQGPQREEPNPSSAPVSIAQMAVAYRAWHTGEQGESDFIKTKRAFEASYGVITQQFYAANIPSAAILTANGTLEILHGLAEGSELERTLLECGVLAAKARRHLDGEARDTAIFDYYAVATTILSYLDRYAGGTIPCSEGESSPDRNNNILAFVRHQFRAANNALDHSLQRMAHREYFAGMINGAKSWLGAIVLLLVGLVAFRVIAPNDPTLWNMLVLFTCFLSGGLGAIVSVMSRMGLQNLSLDPESGSDLLRRLGFFRVIVGAVLGMALYAFVRGDLLPIKVIAQGQDRLYFFAGLAFLAGFGERWAQDMLSGVRARIAGSAQQSSNSDSARTADSPSSTFVAETESDKGGRSS